MATNYQAPNSQYNKDANFAKLGIQEGKKIAFSEAVIRESEDEIVVFAWVTACESVNSYDDKTLTSDTWTGRACKFSLLKKDREYNGKKIEVTPGMQIAIHALKEAGITPDQPFSGFFDFQKTVGDVTWIVKRMDSNDEAAQPISDEFYNLVSKQAFNITPIEALDNLKGLSIPDAVGGGKGGYGRGSGGQKESERLKDRTAFLLAQFEEGSDFYKIAEKLGMPAEQATTWVQSNIDGLMNNLFGG